MLVLIVMSSIFLALPLLDHPSVDARCATGEQYLGADACFLRELLCSIDIAFTIAFTAEMVAKVLASGLLVPYPTAYLRDGWNVLDFFIVRERGQPGASPSVAEAHAAALAIGPRLVGFDRLRLRCLRSGGDGGRPGCLGVAAGAQNIARIARAAPSAHDLAQPCDETCCQLAAPRHARRGQRDGGSGQNTPPSALRSTARTLPSCRYPCR